MTLITENNLNNANKPNTLTLTLHFHRRDDGTLLTSLSGDTKPIQDFGIGFPLYDKLGTRIDEVCQEVLNGC